MNFSENWDSTDTQGWGTGEPGTRIPFYEKLKNKHGETSEPHHFIQTYSNLDRHQAVKHSTSFRLDVFSLDIYLVSVFFPTVHGKVGMSPIKAMGVALQC